MDVAVLQQNHHGADRGTLASLTSLSSNGGGPKLEDSRHVILDRGTIGHTMSDDSKPSLSWNQAPLSSSSGSPQDSGSPVNTGSSGHYNHSDSPLDQPSPTDEASYSHAGPNNLNTDGTDAEGVWSPDIEQAFQEALAIYPPCGRRKIILSDVGKMYGRNELIARYIKLRTGKTRTRKQVSSHIQVLARKKSRELQAKLKDHASKEKAMASLSAMSSAQIVSVHAMANKSVNFGGIYGSPQLWRTGSVVPQIGSAGPAELPPDIKPYSQLGAGPGTFPLSPTPQRPSMSSAVMVGGGGPFIGAASGSLSGPPSSSSISLHSSPSSSSVLRPAYEGRSISAPKLRLCEFCAWVEPKPTYDPSSPGSTQRHALVEISSDITHDHPLLETIDVTQVYDKFPEKNGLKDLFERGPQDAFFLVKFWADITFNLQDEQNACYAVDSRYESIDTQIPNISVSTKVCSFGKQVVEKVETEYHRMEGGRLVYRFERSPMCDYMVNFILKLKQLPERHYRNSVLENFNILQVVTNKDTQETLLCIAFVFEVSDGDGSQHHIYRLVRDHK